MITPAIRQNLQLLQGTPMEDGSPSWLLYDNLRNKYFTLGVNAFRMLKYWISGVDSKQFIEQAQKKGLDIQEDQLNDFINFLKTNSLISHYTSEDVQILLHQHNAQKKHWLMSLIHNYLFFKIPLIKPDPFLDKTLHLAKFFSQKIIRLTIYIIGILGVYFVIQQWEEFLTTFLYFFNWNGLLFYGLALVGVKAIHELGHAYTAKNFGCNVNSMGIAFLVFFPFLYTDNTNAWRLRDHKKRLSINFAGISTELHLALLATFIWGITDQGTLKSVAFFVATTGWISSLLINISPFMRFDGYYVFADYLKIENLQPRAFALAKWKLRHWIFGFKHNAPEQINKQKQTLIIVYAWSTWIYRFFLFLGIAFLVYYFAFKLLGIFLFVVEIVWFILLPIFREMREWWRLRSNIFLSLQFIRSIFLLGALAFIIFYPWKSSQKTPAIYQSEKFIEIFPPINSQAQDIFIKEKQFVQKNQKLINLNSPALNSQIEIVKAELELIEIKINNALDLESNRSDLLRLKSERKKIENKIKNLSKIKSSLAIKAPFEGEITTFNNIQKNQWLNEDTPILKLIDKRNYQVIAFVSEQDISFLDLTKEIRFTPSSTSHENMLAYISSISKSPISNFDMYPMVTSIFDGPIAASEAPSGGIQSEQAYYKVTLDLDQKSSAIENKMLGVVNIGIESKSYFNRFIDFSTATLIRELNF